MLERMQQNWDINELLVELWIDLTIWEGNLELCSKGYKRLSGLWSSHTTAGFIPQRDKRGNMYTKLFIAALFVLAKNCKMRQCPSSGEWLNKLWYMIVMEYYCDIRNDKQDDFRKIWKDLHKLMQSEIRKNRKTLYIITAILWNNQMW